jgi:hypothetical protein
MIRKRSDRGWRAAAFAAALFAITLNFLQPLAHAVVMRDAGPDALGLWTAMCLNDTQDGQPQAPEQAGKQHECCLGLVHTPALAAAPSAFIAVEPTVVAFRFAPGVDALTPVGIRDGPHQPRGPPSLT